MSQFGLLARAKRGTYSYPAGAPIQVYPWSLQGILVLL